MTRGSISIVVLAVLTALPVAETVCAMLCYWAPTAWTHDASGSECDEPARSSSEVQIQGRFEHRCSTHHAVIRPPSTTAAERVDGVGSPLVALAAVYPPRKPLPASETAFAQSAPPGTAPPTTTPLVLRV